MTKFFKIIVTVMLFSLFGGQVPAQKRKQQTTTPSHSVVKLDLAEAIDVIRPSVVQIMLEVVSKQPNSVPKIFPHGSGFFVSSSHVVTARHVVRPKANPDVNVTLLVGLPYANVRNEKGVSVRGNFHLHSAEIVGEDAGHDIALLKVQIQAMIPALMPGLKASPQRIFPVKLNLNSVRDGLPIAISGYPLSTSVLMTNSGYVASSWSLADLNQQAIKLGDTFAGDIRANRGNSGGPVYLVYTGEVVGVFSSINNATVEWPKPDGDTEQIIVDGRPLLYNSGLINIVPAKYVRELMIKHHAVGQP